MSASKLESALALSLQANGVAEPQPEFRFAANEKRRWAFDFAWPDLMVAAECEGGNWTKGRHTRGAGFEADCHKYNVAAVKGWTVLRFTRRMIESGEATRTIQVALALAWMRKAA